MKKEHLIIGGAILAVVAVLVYKHHKKETASKIAITAKPSTPSVATV